MYVIQNGLKSLRTYLRSSHIVFIRFHLSAPVSLMNYSQYTQFVYTRPETISGELGRGCISVITLGLSLRMFVSFGEGLCYYFIFLT